MTSPGFAQVLTPVDFSAASWRAVPLASALAQRFGTHHRVVHVDAASPRHGEGASEFAVGSPPGVEVDVLAATAPDVGIVRALSEHEPSLLVMSTHGHTAAAESAVGSVAEQVLHRWDGPAVVTGPNYEVRDELRRIVVCVEPAWLPPRQLLIDVRAWAAQLAIPVAIFTVTSGSLRFERATEEQRLAEVAHAVSPDWAIGVTRSESGGVTGNIVEFADAVPGTLIALAHRDRSRAARLLLGSVASAVCRRSASAVLLRRYDAADPTAVAGEVS